MAVRATNIRRKVRRQAIEKSPVNFAAVTGHYPGGAMSRQAAGFVQPVAAMQRSGIEAFVGRQWWHSIPLRCIEVTLLGMAWN